MSAGAAAAAAATALDAPTPEFPQSDEEAPSSPADQDMPLYPAQHDTPPTAAHVQPGQPQYRLQPANLLSELNAAAGPYQMSDEILYQLMEAKICTRFWASLQEFYDGAHYRHMIRVQLGIQRDIRWGYKKGPALQVVCLQIGTLHSHMTLSACRLSSYGD